MTGKSALWDRVQATDPKYTKAFNRRGFKGTAINGTYLLKRLTEVFGPCGQGWRFVIDDERIVEGHTLKSNDKSQLHIIKGHLEYKIQVANLEPPAAQSKWISTSPQFGQTMLVGENKNGTYTDEEAPKKSITDCISKCAVMLGFNSDIHLGLWDDNKYVNDRQKAEQERKPVAPTAKTSSKQWGKMALEEIRSCKSLKDLRNWEDARRSNLPRLLQTIPDLHKEVVKALADMYEKLQGKEAAE